VVIALGELGSHIVALQKSEPSLEDVFVELVGRGFEPDDATDGPAAPPTTTATDAHEPADPDPTEVA
jgi:hypothetical protein